MNKVAPKIKIVYYSGTGGTAKVAKCLEEAFRAEGHDVCLQRLCNGSEAEKGEYGLLLLLYAVHACNASEVVYRWIETQETVENIPAVATSVSGVGEVIPNTACRKNSFRKLERKGYRVVYEKMIVMPSNWIVATKLPLARMLLDVLPMKVQEIVGELRNGVIRRTKPHWIDGVFSCIGEVEKYGAIVFGKRVRYTDACTGCGWCSSNCHAGNIILES